MRPSARFYRAGWAEVLMTGGMAFAPKGAGIAAVRARVARGVTIVLAIATVCLCLASTASAGLTHVSVVDGTFDCGYDAQTNTFRPQLSVEREYQQTSDSRVTVKYRVLDGGVRLSQLVG